MSSYDKLKLTKSLLEELLEDSIDELVFQPKLKRIKIKLTTDTLIYIHYNDYEEYFNYILKYRIRSMSF